VTKTAPSFLQPEAVEIWAASEAGQLGDAEAPAAIQGGRERGLILHKLFVRTRRSLNKDDVPVSRPVQRTGVISSRPILGGLHHRYALRRPGLTHRRSTRLSRGIDIESDIPAFSQ
jgi:hypothetical protein